MQGIRSGNQWRVKSAEGRGQYRSDLSCHRRQQTFLPSLQGGRVR